MILGHALKLAKKLYQNQLVILLCLLQCCTSKVCQGERKERVSWGTAEHNEIVISNPACLDENEKLILRLCYGGEWLPKEAPRCPRLLENRDCPGYLFEDFEENQHCVLITESKDWAQRCSLQEAVKRRRPKFYYDNLKNLTFWEPARRRVKFGPFEDVRIGESYGKPFQVRIKDLLKNDCIVRNIMLNKQFVYDCTWKSHHFCLYNKSYELHHCPSNCISSGLGSNQCFCKQFESQTKPKALIKNNFDFRRIARLVGEDSCLVQIDSTASNNTVKLSSNKLYKLDEEAGGDFCKIYIEPALEDFNTELVLSFEESSKKLYLLVYYPEGIYQINNEASINCFTDADEELRKVVEKKVVFQSNNSSDWRLDETPLKVFEIEIKNLIGQYWCEAHKKSSSNDLISSNIVTAYKEKIGNEYALRIKFKNVCQLIYCEDSIDFHKLIHLEVQEVFKHLLSTIRVMEIYNFSKEEDTVDLLYHISTGRDRDVIGEFFKHNNKLLNHTNEFDIVYFRSVEYCLPVKDILNNKIVEFQLTRRGDYFEPEMSCLDSQGIPIRRHCGGTFLTGAEWEESVNYCSSFRPSKLDSFLISIKSNFSESLEEVRKKLEETKEVSAFSFYFLVKFLAKLEDKASAIKTIDLLASRAESSTVSKMKDISDELLNLSEEVASGFKLNSTESLYILDDIVTLAFNPFLSNVRGLVVYKNGDGLEVETLDQNQTFTNITIKEDLILSTYIPDLVIQQLFKENSTDHIVIKVYKDDKLFTTKKKSSVGGPITSITIPSFGAYLESTIPVLIKASREEISSCSFWDYGKKTGRKPGEWSSLGSNYLGQFSKQYNLHICSYSHLTHFALLVLHKEIIEDNDDIVLEMITLLGTFLTVLGTVGIVCTAVIFEQWRKKQGTKILLHLSVSILLEVVFLHLAESRSLTRNHTNCMTLGMLLHYVVLSKFLWMLIYAGLQYLRFVKVLGPTPQNLVLKSVLIGWGLGLLPVVLVALVDPNTYSQHNFCYPSGILLYLAVLLPIYTIIFTNTIIFILVMYQVSNKRIESHSNSAPYILQIKLATLLFFVFGIPWIFALFEFVSVIFTYFFCLTNSFQGFILFLFYVVFNTETRDKWIRYLCPNKLI